jgi:hypothetical protein
MEKKPLVSVDTDPIENWYESPSVIVVNKPAGISVHPQDVAGTGTMLNRVFQNNRWLAQMETSESAGVFHRLADQDHGLQMFIKDDKYQEVVEKAHREGDMRFSYLLTLKGQHTLESTQTNDFIINVTMQLANEQFTMVELESNTGDTETIRNLWLKPDQREDAVFYCYQVDLTLPHTGERRTLALRKPSDHLPRVTVYHAPP